MENKKSIGAFWLKTAKSGTKYMSGVIEFNGEKHNIVMFKNTSKNEDKHPDYRIFLSEEKKENHPKSVSVNNYADVPDDEIPF